jgi:O-antigen/teichoic acid export membrane protein
MRVPSALMTSMAAVVCGKATATVAGLLMFMVLTRHLGPQDFGYYRTVLTYSAFASVFADLGIYVVALREMSRPGADNARIVGNALLLRLVCTAAVLLTASVLAWALPYELVVKRGIFLGALIYTAIQASDFLIAVFQRATRQGGNAIAEAAGALATLGVVWTLSRLGADVLAVLCATLFGSALALAISWRLAWRLIPFRPQFESAKWRQYVGAGLPIAGSQILGMAILRGDTVLLSLFQPAVEVGLYGVPTKIFELATSLPYVFAGLMMPLLVNAAGATSRAEFTTLLSHSLNAATVFGVGAIVALSVFAPQILTVVAGPDFAAGAHALVILAVAIALTGLSIVMRFALLSLDRTRAVLLADAAACAVALLAYLVLIPRYSFTGAAAGTLLAEGTVLVGMLWAFHRTGRRLPNATHLAKVLLAGAIAASTMWMLGRVSLTWPLALFAGGGVYLGVLALSGAVSRTAFRVAPRRVPASQ